MRNNATQFRRTWCEIVSREAISYTFKICFKMRHNFCLSCKTTYPMKMSSSTVRPFHCEAKKV